MIPLAGGELDLYEVRDRVKYDRIVSFAEALPDIRERIDADLRKRSLSRERVLALVLNILDATGLRVGNREYAEKNGSYGVTTLRKKDLPALVEVRFRSQAAHHVRDPHRELALEADLEQPDFTHHTLPGRRSRRLGDG